jgi:pimeloyl-ACP methyl ester carboxylesterase
MFNSAPVAIYEFVGNGKRLRYYNSVKPDKAMLTPVIFIADNIITADFYYDNFKSVAKDRPFYVIELPGMGTNNERPNKAIDQDINLINNWVESLGFEKINLVANSYTTLWAIDFALGFPEKVEKLVLYGTTSRIRESTRKILSYQLDQLREENYKDFAISMAHTMTNYHKILDRDKLDHAIDKFVELAHLQKKNLEAYLEKILAWEDIFRGTESSTDVLIVTGEYDPLSGPYESFLISKKCVSRSMAIISETDHQCLWDKPDICLRLCKRFLKGQPLGRMKDIQLYQKTEYPMEKIRQSNRWLLDTKGHLDLEIGLNVPVEIKEISAGGFHFTCRDVEQKFIAMNHDAVAHIPNEDILIKVAIVPVPDKKGHYIAHYNPQDFNHLNNIHTLIDRLAMQGKPFWKAA